MNISIIAAADLNNCIGKNNTIPWHLPDDLQRFKLLTVGKFCIMGRKTFLSIGKPLPHRGNIVITKNKLEIDLDGMDNMFVVGSFQEAVNTAIANKCHVHEIMIIGGARVYTTALENNLCNRIYLTRVNCEVVDGDTFFPEINKQEWLPVYKQKYTDGTTFTILDHTKRKFNV